VDRFASWPIRLESAAVRAAKTPARHKSLLAFFRTPQIDAESSSDAQVRRLDTRTVYGNIRLRDGTVHLVLWPLCIKFKP
jgi:hypothetical protein